ncbi:hypothetical protein [Gordonia hongkongensis]|uniref:hypothetical protein n=1 Tax=Gordonia hongkongensis TaxID=1701090 RepID=UPI003EBD7B04
MWEKTIKQVLRLIRRIVDVGAIVVVAWLLLCALIVVRTGTTAGIEAVGAATASIVQALIVEPVESLIELLSMSDEDRELPF